MELFVEIDLGEIGMNRFDILLDTSRVLRRESSRRFLVGFGNTSTKEILSRDVTPEHSMVGSDPISKWKIACPGGSSIGSCP